MVHGRRPSILQMSGKANGNRKEQFGFGYRGERCRDDHGGITADWSRPSGPRPIVAGPSTVSTDSGVSLRIVGLPFVDQFVGARLAGI